MKTKVIQSKGTRKQKSNMTRMKTMKNKKRGGEVESKHIVNSITNVVTDGKFNKKEEIFDFHKTMNQLVDSFIYTLKDNSRMKINLINNFKKDQSNYVPRMVILDQARFIQCASTLIQNSINNMFEGQINILVKFDAYKQQVYFEVEDSAKGIRQRDLDLSLIHI